MDDDAEYHPSTEPEATDDEEEEGTTAVAASPAAAATTTTTSTGQQEEDEKDCIVCVEAGGAGHRTAWYWHYFLHPTGLKDGVGVGVGTDGGGEQLELTKGLQRIRDATGLDRDRMLICKVCLADPNRALNDCIKMLGTDGKSGANASTHMKARHPDAERPPAAAAETESSSKGGRKKRQAAGGAAASTTAPRGTKKRGRKSAKSPSGAAAVHCDSSALEASFQHKLEFSSKLYASMSDEERIVYKSVVNLWRSSGGSSPAAAASQGEAGDDGGALETFQEKLGFGSRLYESMSQEEQAVYKSVVKLW